MPPKAFASKWSGSETRPQKDSSAPERGYIQVLPDKATWERPLVVTGVVTQTQVSCRYEITTQVQFVLCRPTGSERRISHFFNIADCDCETRKPVAYEPGNWGRSTDRIGCYWTAVKHFAFLDNLLRRECHLVWRGAAIGWTNDRKQGLNTMVHLPLLWAVTAKFSVNLVDILGHLRKINLFS